MLSPEAILQSCRDSTRLEAILQRLPCPDPAFHQLRAGRPLSTEELFRAWADDWRDASRLLRKQGLLPRLDQVELKAEQQREQAALTLLRTACEMRPKVVVQYLNRFAEGPTLATSISWVLQMSLLVDAVQAAIRPLTGLGAREKTKRTMTAKEANEKAMKVARADRSFVYKTQRQWAKAIGCSVGTVAKLPFWRKRMEELGRGRQDRRRGTPRAVSLSREMETIVGEGDRDEILRQLTEEQQQDDRRRKVHPRV